MNMKYRAIERANLSVSEVGLGCEHLQNKDYETVKSVVDEAIKQGINIFDIFMSEPEVRTNIGKALYPNRDKVILQGHIGAGWENGQYCRVRDIEKVKFHFEDFMKRLQTDYVDIGMLHYIDDENDLDVVMNGDVIKYALELKEKGIIKAIGMSSHSPTVALKAVETGLIDVLMFSINPAYDLLPEDVDIDALFTPGTYKNESLVGTNNVRAKLYKTCELHKTAITVMKTLGAGTLLSAKHSPFGVALTSIQCMHYALTRPSVCSVLIGANNSDEVAQNVKYSTATDEQKDYSMILSSTTKYTAKGRCMYCNHCLPCPSHIDIAQVNKYLDLALVGDNVPASVSEHYKLMDKKASDCVQCGRCEKNCPFDVKIIEKMKKATQVFGV